MASPGALTYITKSSTQKSDEIKTTNQRDTVCKSSEPDCSEYVSTSYTHLHPKLESESTRTNLTGNREENSLTPPTGVRLEHKNNSDDWFIISKHAHPKALLANVAGKLDVTLISGNTLKAIPNCTLPKSMFYLANCLLTISDNHHIIVSQDLIHMCDNSQVATSVKHTTDGFKPDLLTYVSQGKFVGLCLDKKQIRYYNAKTLEILDTFALRDGDDKSMGDLGDRFMSTNAGNLLVQIETIMVVFSPNGLKIEMSVIHTDLLKCDDRTVCIDKDNNIFACMYSDDPSIYMFTLEGLKKAIGKIDGNVTAILSAGVDDSNHLYVCYQSDGANWIARYSYGEY